MRIEIPDYKALELKYLVLDYNGTIALDGVIPDGVKSRLCKLSEELEIYVLTADTHGTAREMCEGLPLEILMCRASALAIAVMEKEGMCGRLLGEADVCTRSIEDALDLLIYPKRLIATLRG